MNPFKKLKQEIREFKSDAIDTAFEIAEREIVLILAKKIPKKSAKVDYRMGCFSVEIERVKGSYYLIMSGNDISIRYSNGKPTKRHHNLYRLSFSKDVEEIINQFYKIEKLLYGD